MATLNPNIWQLQANGDIDALIKALKDPDAATRRGAAVALRALAAGQAVPALQAALIAEQDSATQAAIAAALEPLEREVNVRQMIEAKNISGLTKMLASSNIDDIKWACIGLGAIGDRHAAEPLVILFRNPLQPNAARLAAAEALLKLESAPAVVTLLGALRRDNWQVRRNAAAVLGQLQAGWATDALVMALNDPHQAVQRTAAAALRRISTPEAIQAVTTYEETQRKLHAGTQPLPPLETILTPEEMQPSRIAKWKEATQDAPAAPSTDAQPVEATQQTADVATSEVAKSVDTPVPEVKPAEVTQESAAVASVEISKPVDTPAPDVKPAEVTQESAAISTIEVAKSVDVPVPEVKPITGPLPRPPWHKQIEEPPTHLDDTRPSRPTQLRSPFKTEGDTKKE